MSDQSIPTMEEGPEKTGKDDVPTKLRKECRK